MTHTSSLIFPIILFSDDSNTSCGNYMTLYNRSRSVQHLVSAAWHAHLPECTHRGICVVRKRREYRSKDFLNFWWGVVWTNWYNSDLISVCYLSRVGLVFLALPNYDSIWMRWHKLCTAVISNDTSSNKLSYCKLRSIRAWHKPHVLPNCLTVFKRLFLFECNSILVHVNRIS